MIHSLLLEVEFSLFFLDVYRDVSTYFLSDELNTSKPEYQ